MTPFQESLEDILTSAADDWVSTGDVLNSASVSLYNLSSGEKPSFEEAKQLVLQIVDEVLRQGWVQIGEVEDGFMPWKGNHEQIMERVKQPLRKGIRITLGGLS